MIFVGKEENGYFAEEIAIQQDIQFYYIEPNVNIEKQVNSILECYRQNYTIFDIEQYIDDADIIAKNIECICKANGSQPIIYASGYKTYSTVILKLVEYGVKYFIFGVNQYEMKDQLLKCMNGYYDANGIEIVKEMQEAIKKEDVEQLNSTSTTIAVAGSMPRMGTTTIAIQLVKYLQYKGKKACCIFMNSPEYFEALREWYEKIEEDEEIGLFRLENVDHFYDVTKIKEIFARNYDYYIYDYGNYFDTNFNRVSFLEKNLQVFVVGADTTELKHTSAVINSAFYDDVNYVYNFVAEADREDIVEFMDNKADNTYFAPYCPDKYIFTPEGAAYLEKLIPLEDITENVSKSKKGFLFKRSKKKVR